MEMKTSVMSESAIPSPFVEKKEEKREGEGEEYINPQLRDEMAVLSALSIASREEKGGEENDWKKYCFDRCKKEEEKEEGEEEEKEKEEKKPWTIQRVLFLILFINESTWESNHTILIDIKGSKIMLAYKYIFLYPLSIVFGYVSPFSLLSHASQKGAFCFGYVLLFLPLRLFGSFCVFLSL